MRYRTFGRLDWKPSALGFGAMRLPMLDGDYGKIDEDLATRMVRTAIDRGVNYVDTAWPYHSEQSERFLGRCLRGSSRRPTTSTAASMNNGGASRPRRSTSTSSTAWTACSGRSFAILASSIGRRAPWKMDASVFLVSRSTTTSTPSGRS